MINAPDVLAAASQAMSDSICKDHTITLIEEIIPAIALYVSDQELSDLLMQEETEHHDQEPLHPADWESDQVVFRTEHFNTAVEKVTAKLGESFLPGLFLTVVNDLDGDHALIQMRDEATGHYRTKTAPLEDLIQDRDATGWTAILAIASAVIAQAAELI